MQNDVLVIGTTSSQCGNCSHGASPYETAHTTALPGYRKDTRHRKGCGIVWTKVAAGTFYDGIEESIKRMRPDLEYIEYFLPGYPTERYEDLPLLKDEDVSEERTNL